MAGPTPEQRADYLVRKLENLIREGKTERGMSFKTWQALARSELSNAFSDFERQLLKSRQDAVGKRLILVGATAMVTIGFWGAALTVDRRYGDLVAYIFIGAGILLAGVLAEISFRRLANRYRTVAREKSFERIADFDKQLKRLEAEIWLKLKKTREQAEADE
ncbi:hypothetical protein [Telmatospirillum siberiense]|uniref:Uncharacterized protein n=1 Tax=Telmatospirillum siberiense TaxID=382514 RepID=A0A2N3PM03_9PROT|nr:hypothetical protein [Telmatospirillum siberiense]PKU21431.1 hypothetical protein CWS72_26805 [Telmatospirillum siberiense]